MAKWRRFIWSKISTEELAKQKVAELLATKQYKNVRYRCVMQRYGFVGDRDWQPHHYVIDIQNKAGKEPTQ